jgi:DNA-binding XRE family transcriptional regulator
MAILTEVARSRVSCNNASGRTTITGRIPPDRVTLTVRPETFGERVGRLRRALRWDQRQLAQAAGVGQMTVSQCERDLLPGVTAYTVACLARALGVTMGFLWTGGEEQRG